MPLDLDRITGASKWASPQAASFVPPAVPTYAYDGPYADGPAVFDVMHRETSLVYATNWGFSRTVLGVQEPADGDIRVPMGHTNLVTLEKRAVVNAGELVRLWPAAYPPDPGRREEWRLIVPPTAELGFLHLGATVGIKYAVRDALNLSARLGGAVLVARMVQERPWH